jgi:hypothetical protein
MSDDESGDQDGLEQEELDLIESGKVAELIGQLKRTIRALEISHESLERRVKELEKTGKANTKKAEDALKAASDACVRSGSGSSWAEVCSGKKKKTDEQIALLNAASRENEERCRKESNVVVFGLPTVLANDQGEKSSELKKTAVKVLRSIGVTTEFKAVHSMRENTSTKTTPIVIVMNSTADRNMALKASKRLQNVIEFKDKVFLSPDLTEAQRAVRRMLIKERNEKNDGRSEEEKEEYHFGIRNDTVIKITHRQ